MDKDNIKHFAGKHLDMWIGQYFSTKENREKYTLGEFLVEILPKLGNIYVLEYLNPRGPNS